VCETEAGVGGGVAAGLTIATVSISAGSAGLTGVPHFKQNRLVAGSSAEQVWQCGMGESNKEYRLC
jgi:hypothetical protein